MARGKKTGGRDIKPGQVLNPTGRPKLPEDLKSARKMNKTEFERLLNKYLAMDKDELTKAMSNDDIPALDMIVCQVIIKAIKGGDYLRLNFLLDRLIGKAKDVIETHHSGESRILILPDNNRKPKLEE